MMEFKNSNFDIFVLIVDVKLKRLAMFCCGWLRRLDFENFNHSKSHANEFIHDTILRVTYS